MALFEGFIPRVLLTPFRERPTQGGAAQATGSDVAHDFFSV